MKEANFKDTEIGKIPVDWEVKTLGELGDVKMCRRIFQHQTSENGEIPFFKIGTFGKEPDAYITRNLFENFKNKFSFPVKGEILISAAGTIGRTVIYNGEESYFQDSNIVWINNKEEIISNKLLKYIFERIKYDTEGSTIKRLYNSILKNTSFICPPLSEQEKIAEVLSDIDLWIESTEVLLAKKRLIKKGAMQKLLSSKEDWEVRKLGEVCEFLKGRGLCKSELIIDGKNKCIHYGELFTKYSEKINDILSKTNSSENVVYSKINDVLMPTSDVTPRGLATASCINENGIILGGDILIIRFNKNIDGVYFSYFITDNKEKVLKYVSGSTVYHLYGSELKNLDFTFPSLNKQQEIAEILSLMDLEIESLENCLQKTR